MKMSHSSTHYYFLVLCVLVDQIPQCHKLPHSLEKKCSFLFIHDYTPIPVSVFFKEQTIMDFRELLTESSLEDLLHLKMFLFGTKKGSSKP